MKNWRLGLLVCSLMSSQITAQEPHTDTEFPSASGNAFVRFCSVIDNSQQDGHDEMHIVACSAYVEGVVDGVNAEIGFSKSVVGKESPKPYCLPKDAENGQLIRMILKYVRNHPEEAHKITSVLIVETLLEAFPCGSKK
jgi:Rap1a immunity proteins